MDFIITECRVFYATPASPPFFFVPLAASPHLLSSRRELSTEWAALLARFFVVSSVYMGHAGDREGTLRKERVVGVVRYSKLTLRNRVGSRPTHRDRRFASCNSCVFDTGVPPPSRRKDTISRLKFKVYLTPSPSPLLSSRRKLVIVMSNTN